MSCAWNDRNGDEWPCWWRFSLRHRSPLAAKWVYALGRRYSIRCLGWVCLLLFNRAPRDYRVWAMIAMALSVTNIFVTPWDAMRQNYSGCPHG